MLFNCCLSVCNNLFVDVQAKIKLIAPMQASMVLLYGVLVTAIQHWQAITLEGKDLVAAKLFL
jgi:CBS-domain-containing membrane protein